ncbi:MAG: S-methyl-5'-thioadenosine phosphorylase [Elusimicrobia bacterium]|nr:S-methyl-5'-thioadenosine phosphorylase [Candidatus Liberimonas magnetica]
MAKKNEKTEPVKVAIIGGSGTYEIDGIENLKEVKVKTPFGDPSDAIVVGRLEGVMCAFLPRHARVHRISPSELNSRANIYALKSLGAQQIISVSAVGSLKEEIKPRDFVIPDQLFDRTKARPCTFFGDGIVAHVGFANPFCNDIRAIIHKGVEDMGIKSHFGGTYVCIEGPQFSTKAESEVNRKLGFSIVGMTAIPEAKLAREAEICYTTVALVTDYDVWKEGEEVSVEAVIETLKANTANVKKLIKNIVPVLAGYPGNCACRNALQFAIMTKIDKRNKKTYEKLKLLIGKYV